MFKSVRNPIFSQSCFNAATAEQNQKVNSQAMALSRGTYDGDVGGESGLGRSCITVILWRKSANSDMY